MTNTETIDQAQANAEKTMALLKDQRRRQIPQNFTIWYGYLSESNPDLVRTLNDLLAKDGKFTEKMAQKVFSDFFTFEKEGEAIRETNRLVRQSMYKVRG